MTPVDLPPLEPSSIRPGGQWQPPATEARTAAPVPAADAWTITGAGWPVRPEEVFGLLLSWPETRNVPTPQAVADLRQLFESNAVDVSDVNAVFEKLQAVFRGSSSGSAASDWTARLMSLLDSQIERLGLQAGTKAGSTTDGLTKLIRHALTVLNRESASAPTAARDASPPLPPAIRIVQNAGEQSYLISERETVSGLLTQQAADRISVPPNAARTLPQVSTALPTQQPGAGQTAAGQGAANAPAGAPAPQTPGAYSQAVPLQQQSGLVQSSGQGLPAQAQTGQEAAVPQAWGNASGTSSMPTSPAGAVNPGAPAPVASAPASVSFPHPVAPAFSGGVDTQAAVAANAQTQGDVPMPSMAEIIARASSLQSQAPSTPPLRWPFLTSLSEESVPAGAANRPVVQPETALTAASVSRPERPEASAHAFAGRGNPGSATQVATGQAPAAESPGQAWLRGEVRSDVAGAAAAPSARVDEAAQSAAMPQQRVGMIPLMVGQESMPAWLQMEWKPVDDREGNRGQAKGQQALMVSVHIAGETLGRVAFHLAWLPKELAGTIIMDKPEVLRAAQEELPGLETRLAEAGLPPPRLRILRHAAVPWQEETSEMERT